MLQPKHIVCTRARERVCVQILLYCSKISAAEKLKQAQQQQQKRQNKCQPTITHTLSAADFCDFPTNFRNKSADIFSSIKRNSSRTRCDLANTQGLGLALFNRGSFWFNTKTALYLFVVHIATLIAFWKQQKGRETQKKHTQ